MSFFVNDNDRLWKGDQKRKLSLSFSPWIYLIFILFLILIVVGIWYIWPSSSGLTKAELPFIKANENPVKIRSQDQSVPGITHQDKLVYDRIRQNDASSPVEHILPDQPAPIQMTEPYVPEEKSPEDPSVSIEDLIVSTTEKKDD